ARGIFKGHPLLPLASATKNPARHSHQLLNLGLGIGDGNAKDLQEFAGVIVHGLPPLPQVPQYPPTRHCTGTTRSDTATRCASSSGPLHERKRIPPRCRVPKSNDE